MLQGKDLILATKPFAKEDRAKSWRATLSTLVLLGLAFAGAVLPSYLAVQLCCGVLAALLLVRTFIIYHDYLHHTILKNSVAANIIFTFFGLYILAPRSIWKRSHDYHHNHNSQLHSTSIGSFPILTKRKFLSLRKGQRNMYLFIRHPLTIAAGYIFAFTWGMCMLSLWRSPGKHWDSALSLLFHFGIGVAVFLTFGIQSFLIGFLLPSVISSAIGSYLFYAQHNFPAAKFTDKAGWTYHGAALHSSSYMKMNPLMRWFTANIGYHHIHHLNSRIPFYRLPAAMAAFEELQNPPTTSLNPVDIFRCLQVKVWDPEADRMITSKEIAAAS